MAMNLFSALSCEGIRLSLKHQLNWMVGLLDEHWKCMWWPEYNLFYYGNSMLCRL